MHSFTHDIRGATFGALTVVGYAGRSKQRTMWLCECACGKQKDIDGSSLKRGQTRSCGCLRRRVAGLRNLSHGHTSGGESPEHVSYRSMRGRCLDPNHLSYQRYGARGISICNRWRNGDGILKSGFECFLEDVGFKPGAEYTLERSDSSGNYEPGNCVWATPKDQVRNRSNTIFVIWKGSKTSLGEVCETTGTPYRFAIKRVHHPKWPIERIVERAAMLRAAA